MAAKPRPESPNSRCPRPNAYATHLVCVGVLLLSVLCGAQLSGAEKAPEQSENAGREVVLKGLSDEAAREVYRVVRRRAMVGLGYEETGRAPGSAQTGLDRCCRLLREDEEGRTLSLSLGLDIFATQEPRLYLEGAVAEKEKADNPDLQDLAEAAGAAAKKATQAPRSFTARELSREVFQLSYVDVETALKILGRLGYSTGPPKGELNANQLPAVFGLDQKTMRSTLSGAKSQKLEQPTITGPEERLMILYHCSQSELVAKVKHALETVVDVPAAQVLIEGMIIELNEDALRDLGTEFSIEGGERRKISFGAVGEPAFKEQLPFILSWDPDVAPPADWRERVEARLRMIVEEGTGEILSSPSVLVVDNRNARIAVTEELPIIEESLLQDNRSKFNVRFEEVGIELNIKPRIDRKATAVAMQVRAEVSEAPEFLTRVVNGEVLKIAPLINRRTVTTIARVRGNTPFIIGGLIRNERSTKVDRIPFLSRMPVLGWLFQRRQNQQEKREVIIVLTPRVIKPRGSDRPVLPKDTERFDFLNNRLFRNSYRLKAEDVFDLGFLKDNRSVRAAMQRARRFVNRNPEYADRSPFKEMVEGVIPGEDAVVIRMLYEVVKYKLALHEQIKTENLILFGRDESKPGGFDVKWLADDFLKPKSLDGTVEGYFGRPYPKEILLLRFKANPEGGLEAALQTPVTEVEWIPATAPEEPGGTPPEVRQKLLEINRLNDDYLRQEVALALAQPGDLVRLKDALVIREIEKVNDFGELVRLSNFRVGRRIIIPEFEGPHERILLVDRAVAEYFFKSDYYYHALKQRLEMGYRIIEETLAEESR